MVRAGVVRHPQKWRHCGYHEIQQPPTRYRIIDQPSLLELCYIRSLKNRGQEKPGSGKTGVRKNRGQRTIVSNIDL